MKHHAAVQPMQINIPDENIEDLHRLRHTAVTVPAPREWAERFYNVQRWTIMERGGHFSEWEMPNEIADDIRQFFAGMS